MLLHETISAKRNRKFIKHGNFIEFIADEVQGDLVDNERSDGSISHAFTQAQSDGVTPDELVALVNEELAVKRKTSQRLVITHHKPDQFCLEVVEVKESVNIHA